MNVGYGHDSIVKAAAEQTAKLRYANGVVFRAFGDGVLDFVPALSFTAGEFDLMFERVRRTLDDVLADTDVQRAARRRARAAGLNGQGKAGLVAAIVRL